MTVDSVSLGSEANSFFAEINFSGALSELNIWSVALSSDQMLSITNNCENNSSNPNPDILNWSEVTESMIAGEIREVDLMNLCYYSLDATETVVPVFLDQIQAIAACQSLKANSYPPQYLEQINGIRLIIIKIYRKCYFF